jgi:hypothetical protein
MPCQTAAFLFLITFVYCFYNHHTFSLVTSPPSLVGAPPHILLELLAFKSYVLFLQGGTSTPSHLHHHLMEHRSGAVCLLSTWYMSTSFSLAPFDFSYESWANSILLHQHNLLNFLLIYESSSQMLETYLFYDKITPVCMLTFYTFTKLQIFYLTFISLLFSLQTASCSEKNEKLFKNSNIIVQGSII